ncbi:TrbC/VirB2 family protein [Kribbella sp. NPDC051952]|jgi:type IV secretory pathway VirB2 component (pilin)|uniref:TrbC/VirB2 family protein n=1 Tax=Kribbella sp. NPDC051952 TaxID=3154851 RepID=UPI00341370B3
MMLVHLISEAQNLLPLDPVNPGTGSKPPGSGGLEKVISWVTWIAFAICVLGIIIAGAMMAVGQRRGEGGEHAARLGWVLAACIVIGSASGFVGILQTTK